MPSRLKGMGVDISCFPILRKSFYDHYMNLTVIVVALVSLACVPLSGCVKDSRFFKTVRNPAQMSPENCTGCHVGDLERNFKMTRHHQKNVNCQVCHYGKHTEYEQTVSDSTCGQCHSSQYIQTYESKHTAQALTIDLADKEIRKQLRLTRHMRNGRYVNGLLCIACHFDQHGPERAKVKKQDFCLNCHNDRQGHYPDVEAPDNRCLKCHVYRGQTSANQVVNSHKMEIK